MMLVKYDKNNTKPLHERKTSVVFHIIIKNKGYLATGLQALMFLVSRDI